MEKNWLIRTKSNHILGPVSQAKVQELLESSILKSEDEVCSGNGFWFYVREKDLVKRFVYDGEKQPFNPVSEAENVLTPHESNFFEESHPTDDELVLEINPLKEEEEEEFPEFTEMAPPSKSGADDIQFPESSDLDYPEALVEEEYIEEEEHIPPQFDSTSNLTEPPKPKINKTQRKSVQAVPAAAPQKSWLNDKSLFLIAISMLVVAILAFYYRKRIIEKFIDGQASISLVGPVYAQTFTSAQKKNL